MCLNPVPPSGFKWGGKGISRNCATRIVNVEQTGCLIQPWKMSTLGLAGNLNRKAMTKQFFCSPKSKARWFIISKKVSFKNQQTNTQSPAAVHRHGGFVHNPGRNQVPWGSGGSSSAKETQLLSWSPVPSQIINEGNVTKTFIDRDGGRFDSHSFP